MKRAMRWLKRIVLGTIALAVIAVIAALIILHTDWGRNQIRKQIEIALVESFPGGAKVGALEGSVFGTLVVRDIVLFDLDKKPLVTVASVELELELLPLITKTAHIDRLLVQDVVITKRMQTLEPPPPPPAGAMTVEIPWLEVRRISAVIETPQGPLTIDNGSATAQVSVLPGGYVDAIANVTGTWRERKAPIAVLVGARIGEEIKIPFARVAAGGVEVVATTVNVDAMAGTVAIDGPAAAITQLVPEVDLPADVVLTLTTTPRTGEGLQLLVAGYLGGAAIDGALIGNLETMAARGVIGVRGANIGVLTKGEARGHGTAIIAVVTDGLRVRGTVIASGAVILADGEVTVKPGRIAPAVSTTGAASGTIGGHVIAAFDATLGGGTALVLGTGAGDTAVGVIGSAERVGTSIVVKRTLIGATTKNPGAASGGMAPIRGELAVEIAIEGPSEALVAAGTVNGSRIAFADKRVGRVAGRFNVKILTGKEGPEVLGTAHAEIANVVNAGSPVGSFTVDVRNRRDGKIAVSGQARLDMAPVVVDAEALITPSEVIDIALGPHRVRTEKGELVGDGGSIQIDETDIVIKGIKTALVGGGKGTITVDATIGKESKNLIADLDVRDIPAALIDPAYRGTASANLSITQKRGHWAGGGNVVVKQFALTSETLPIDAEGKVRVDGRRVAVAGRVSNPEIGAARVEVVVDGPKDLTDAAAWMRVQRGDLQSITIGVERLDLAALTDDRTAGTADGVLVITAGVPSGSLAIRDIPTPVGEANADITLSLTDVGYVDAIAKATVGTIGAAEAEVRLQVPDRVFDPDSWKALGAAAVNRATVRTSDIAFDSRLFAQVGIDAPYSGRASAEIRVSTGGSSVEVTANVRDVRGGAIQRGVNLAMTARTDNQGTTATVRATSGELTLLDLPDASSPVTLDRWVANPKAELASKIAGTLSIPRIPAREVLAIFGRTDILMGSVQGKVEVGGTVLVPTAKATLEILSLKVKPRLVTRPPPVLTAMNIEAGWDGKAGTLRVTGTEANKGSIEIDAALTPADLSSLRAKLKIKDFDVAPVVVFLPGPLVGASGKIEADLTIKGVDIKLGTADGFIHLINARVPITPVVGTLRRADVRIDANAGGIDVTLDGRVGPGSIKLKATTTDLVNAELTGEITRFQPIIAAAPFISGRILGNFKREGLTWRGAAKIYRASIDVPEEAGNVLLDATTPEDLIFVDRPIPLPKRLAEAPQRPFIIANVTLESTRVTMPQFQVFGSIAGNVEVSVGETLGLDGQVFVETATLVILGHRYRVDLGQVTFDGTPDALVDVKLAHDFPAVTMFVRVATRLSQIDKVEPIFTSEPGIYTQGQLLGFFLGGAPGGDPSKQTAEAAAGFGAALASLAGGKALKRVPLVKRLLERVQIGCKPGAGQSSAACTAGTWVSKRVYVTGEARLNARADENANEAKIEYYWKPWRTVEIIGGDRRFFGIDLLWRHRW